MLQPVPYLDADQLRAISASTIAHYQRFAEAYRDGTWDHDVSQNIAALLGAIGGAAAAPDPRSRLRPRTRPDRFSRSRARSDRPGRLRRVRRHGARRVGLRGLVAGHAGAGSAGAALRWRLRERRPVSRPKPGTAAGAGRSLGGAQARGGAVLLQPARPERGGLGGRALRLLLRFPHLAADGRCGRL